MALTIDDGWDPVRCEQMRETLLAAGVPATWFPNAIYVRRHPALWRRIARHFPIGNHSYSHPDLTRLSSSRVRDQLVRDQRVIEGITGQPMAMLLRPPFGALDHRVRRVARELGYDTIVLWDTTDADSSPRTTVRGGIRAASRGLPGSIVLLHCGPAVTPDILPGVIRHYACAGYRFVTVPGLLARDPGVEADVDCTLASATDAAEGAIVRALVSLGEGLLGFAQRLLVPTHPDPVTLIDPLSTRRSRACPPCRTRCAPGEPHRSSVRRPLPGSSPPTR